LGFRERAAEAIPADELMRVDACDLAAHRLSMVDVAQYLLFQAKHIRLALRAGEPSRVAIGLMDEAALKAFEGGAGLVRGEEVWKQGMSVAERTNDPLVLAKCTMWGGYVTWAAGNWKESLSLFERAGEIAARAHVLHALGLIKMQHGMLDCLMFLGRLRDYGGCLAGWLNDARRRGDRFATCALLVHSYVPCLAAGRPEDAEAVTRQGWEEWPHPGNIFGTYWVLYGRAEAALYRGEGRRAWELIRRERASLNRATLYEFLATLNLLMVHLHARAALAAAAAEPVGGFFSPRARLLRCAARDARRIERRRLPRLNPLATLIRAGLANLHGKREEAVSLLEAAEKGLEASDMELYAAAARRQRGTLMGGEGGQTLVASADAWMAGQDIRNPARIAAMLVPGFAD
jgi:hypothetical protein